MSRFVLLIATTVALLIVSALTPTVVDAHQPFCEFSDLTAQSPWEVPDPDVSYAFYANMYPGNDVDYYTFQASAGQDVFLQMVIPDIPGQEDFVPMMAVMGPGMATMDALPDRVEVPDEAGSLVVPLVDEARHFYEQFGRKYYWQWQDITFEAPVEGEYTVAVWHADERIGRYTFVVGIQEILGGDRNCMAAFNDYWTVLEPGQNPYIDDTTDDDHDHDHEDGDDHHHEDGDDHDHADDHDHDHSMMLDLSGEAAIPSVDVQLIPMEDGGYNLRVQTLNFEFAPQRVGMDHVPGEGHAHLYINGEKITRIYGEWYYLETLPEGAQEISVGLYANNHQALAVDGVAINATVDLSDMELMHDEDHHDDHEDDHDHEHEDEDEDDHHDDDA